MEEAWELAVVSVFLSWSGEYSHNVAKAFSGWLKCVLQDVEFFLSSSSIQPGSRWDDVISGELEKSSFGVLFLTEDNKDKPWVLFEAGALAKRVGDSYVVPVLIDTDSLDLSNSPLYKFNRIKADKEGVRNLVGWIQERVSQNNMDKSQVDRIFEKWWPDLENELSEIPQSKPQNTPKDLSVKERLGRIETALELALDRTRLSRKTNERYSFSNRSDAGFLFKKIFPAGELRRKIQNTTDLKKLDIIESFADAIGTKTMTKAIQAKREELESDLISDEAEIEDDQD